jgi:hypothetical protein
MTKPYRPCPPDFRETYIRMGWDGIDEHYRTNYRCIARWVQECGGDELRRERSQVTGLPMRSHNRSNRYTAAANRIGGGDSAGPRVPSSGTWLKAFGGAYRLLLPLAQINELERRFSLEDRDGVPWPKSFMKIHTALCGGWNDIEDSPFPVGAGSPSASIEECRETVRQALIGGGMAVIDGELRGVGPAEADRIVRDQFFAAPLETMRRIASIILAWVIMGPPKPNAQLAGEPA